MQANEKNAKPKKAKWRKWVNLAFICWAIFSTSWLLNSFRTQNLDENILNSDPLVKVIDAHQSIQLLPNTAQQTALVFISGGGVAAKAYVPMLRPIAQRGYPVFIIKLPFRLAPLESHKQGAIDRVHHILDNHPKITSWALSGHSLGAALASRVARDKPEKLSALALVGSTHPKRDNLSSLSMPVIKVYGSQDGVAPVHKINANKGLLPKHTKWILIDGANHSQFGHYGKQLLDGKATISREIQQSKTRDALLALLQSL